MNEVSQRLKEAIKASGLSQREIENITGVPHSAIQRYASGDTDNIPLGRLKLIADAIGTTAEYILGWDKKESPATENGSGQIARLSPNDLKIIELLMSLSESKKVEAINYLRYLAERSDK